ncbi:alpha/beta hydrolase [Lacibacter sediminis]|uniref:Alpha/beta hydrolase n=1 Tax=Lacibacter sediminis TaxID=2760713 RepID=A0A7G5XII4_9BACT|nr:alpha/beta hydrolase-fold protein [Lacibacter sediminis]QNA45287.1 alpha/beta hydrolase [Lacibacter sediminis]
MLKTGLLFLLLHCHIVGLNAQQPAVSNGELRRFPDFPSSFVGARNIDVWLPSGYSSKKKYAVLYMHDGQMLFDSTVTWNKQEWGVDEAMTKLLNEKKIKDCIVVGVWNTGTMRHADYFPQKPFLSLTPEQQDSIYKATRGNGYTLFASAVQSDAYLKFLVSELKPFIDKTFSVKTDRANTFIAGSSMGGLISMYAICEYPNVFGGAACLSTHWPGIFATENNPIPATFIRYLKNNLPNPSSHKIYFDYGTAGLDSLYKPFQLQADEVMKAKGYTSINWLSKEFTGEDHSENAWRKRLNLPLIFLLKK